MNLWLVNVSRLAIRKGPRVPSHLFPPLLGYIFTGHSSCLRSCIPHATPPAKKKKRLSKTAMKTQMGILIQEG
jgi:hypothetical protein